MNDFNFENMNFNFNDKDFQNLMNNDSLSNDDFFKGMNFETEN